MTRLYSRKMGSRPKALKLALKLEDWFLMRAMTPMLIVNRVVAMNNWGHL